MRTPRVWLIATTLTQIAGCSFDGGAASSTFDATGDDAGGTADADDAIIIDAAADGCPADYAPIAGSTTRYRIVDTAASWAEAAADCADDATGGPDYTHLIVLGGEPERLAIDAVLAGAGNRWLGLSDEVADQVFVWVTAEDTGTYPTIGDEPPWKPGQPVAGDAEHCVRINNATELEDKSCLEAQRYLCECDRFAPR